MNMVRQGTTARTDQDDRTTMVLMVIAFVLTIGLFFGAGVVLLWDDHPRTGALSCGCGVVVLLLAVLLSRFRMRRRSGNVGQHQPSGSGHCPAGSGEGAVLGGREPTPAAPGMSVPLALPPAVTPAPPAPDYDQPGADAGAVDSPWPDQLAVPARARLLGQPSVAANSPWYLPVVSTQPAVAADQARLGDLEVRAASIIGTGHRSSDPATPRQDAYRLGRDTAGRHLIIAVADGMSDSERSDHGATVAVSTAVAVLRRHLDTGATLRDLSAAEVFREVSGTIVRSLEGRNMTEMDVRTGLIVAVISVLPTRDGHREAWFGHLADLSAWQHSALPGTGWTHLAGDRKNDGMDSNSLSRFLPFSPGDARDTRARIPAGAIVALMSDGVSDALTGIPGANDWFARQWTSPPAVAQFIQQIGFEAKTFTDDRTAVVIWCDPSRPVLARTAGTGWLPR
ncbi:protein phosphatase 2C domain-containing protein [Frankia sp. AgPm24]|nr:protein phosphatase 2C domain-containing protein [Frankia sp. AgPm24]